MKKFTVVFMVMILITVNCYAMTFSQPVGVGNIGHTPASPFDGYGIENATFIQATPAKNNGRYYRGKANWKTGKDNLFCHFEYNNDYIFKFGDENISNSVEIKTPSVRIQKINNSQNKTIYLLNTSWGSASSFWRNFGYAVIGKMDNGKWVKYFSVEGSFNPSTGIKDVAPHPRNLICKGDTIIIEFYSNKRDSGKVYEMRYKWDDLAQWFGVEKVTY